MSTWKDKQTVMQRYNETAEGYEELHAQEQKAKYYVGLKDLNVVQKVVLDVGCGSGLLFQEVESNVRLIVGLDISRKLLVKANEKAKAFENVAVVQADADYLPFQRGSFNVVFSFTVLQNVPEPTKTLVEMKRVAEKDGKLVVTALKKAFTIPFFMDLIEDAGLSAVSFVDDENLKCYVSVLVLNRLAPST